MTAINRLCLSYFTPLLRAIEESRKNPMHFQQEVFSRLIRSGSETAFGREHRFSGIRSIQDFQQRVPIRDYNAIQPYINRLRSGEAYVLWNQRVKWFAKSSGTSSDKSKYIPITPDNLRECHMGGFLRLISSFLYRHPESRILTGKALTLGGSVQLDEMSHGHAFNGDLSAILLKNSPWPAELLRTPPREVAMIPHFQEKIEKICRICSKQNITNFSGVPSWNLVLINKVLEYNNAKVLTDVWPNLELFMHGGINFAPYREQYHKLIPKSGMRYVENYNASEGYFAFQDDDSDASMLLTVNNGVFFEFIPITHYDNIELNAPCELDTLESVVPGRQYAMVISSNSGLWRYLIGDCVEFTSVRPHKIKITGRTQLYINAFGEELMISNAENALANASQKCHATVNEYTVAPLYMTADRKGSHQWLIEFAEPPADLSQFTQTLDRELCDINSDYEAKRTHNTTMLPPVVIPLPQGSFLRWMEERKKVGGQNKIPRLSNDRHVVEELLKLLNQPI